MTYNQKWSVIDNFGKLKISKSSYIYIVVVPILTKIFENIKSPIELVFGENTFLLDINFPFTWYTFYVGALFIALGSAVYTIWCPEVIKKYPDYGTFLSAGRSDYYLEWTVRTQCGNEGAAKKSIEELSQISPTIRDETTVPAPPGSRGAGLLRAGDKIINKRSENPEYNIQRRKTFNTVLDTADMRRACARWFATTFYFLGVGFFIIIIIYNAVVVIAPDLIEFI